MAKSFKWKKKCKDFCHHIKGIGLNIVRLVKWNIKAHLSQNNSLIQHFPWTKKKSYDLHIVWNNHSGEENFYKPMVISYSLDEMECIHLNQTPWEIESCACTLNWSTYSFRFCFSY